MIRSEMQCYFHKLPPIYTKLSSLLFLKSAWVQVLQSTSRFEVVVGVLAHKLSRYNEPGFSLLFGVRIFNINNHLSYYYRLSEYLLSKVLLITPVTSQVLTRSLVKSQ